MHESFHLSLLVYESMAASERETAEVNVRAFWTILDSLYPVDWGFFFKS